MLQWSFDDTIIRSLSLYKYVQYVQCASIHLNMIKYVQYVHDCAWSGCLWTPHPKGIPDCCCFCVLSSYLCDGCLRCRVFIKVFEQLRFLTHLIYLGGVDEKGVGGCNTERIQDQERRKGSKRCKALQEIHVHMCALESLCRLRLSSCPWPQCFPRGPQMMVCICMYNGFPVFSSLCNANTTHHERFTSQDVSCFRDGS